MHHVEILASSACGHCRHLTDIVTDACAGTDTEVHAVDVSRYPEAAAARAGVLHSPVVLVDGHVLPSSWSDTGHGERRHIAGPLGDDCTRLLRELRRSLR